ncbi:MAG: efflux RND transporter permease subunit [Verrucomicrobiales bacterium]
MKLEIWKDDSKYLQGRLSLLSRNAAFGFVLVLIVLSLFLRPALASLVALGIPVAFLGAVAVMPFLGVSVEHDFAFCLHPGVGDRGG